MMKCLIILITVSLSNICQSYSMNETLRVASVLSKNIWDTIPNILPLNLTEFEKNSVVGYPLQTVSFT